MKKLMRPRDRILFLLAGMGDLAMFLHEEVGIGKMSLKQLYGWTPSNYKRGNFSQAVRRMLKTGYVEKVVKNGKPYLRLSNKGEKTIQRDFLLLSLQKKRWDGKWRLVIFDIKENKRWKRDFFRGKIKELGLGMIQKSVYLTPFDICQDLYEFAEENDLKDAVFVMEISHLLIGNAKLLASKIWPLEEINKKYREILIKVEEVKSLKDRQRKDYLRDLKSKYLELLLKDPLLPKELLPSVWLRDKVDKALFICGV